MKPTTSLLSGVWRGGDEAGKTREPSELTARASVMGFVPKIIYFVHDTDSG